MLYKRTHMCGELRLTDEGKNVVLNGWVAKARSLGGLVFVDIRDKTGITQVTFNEDVPADVIEKAKSLRSEYCIGVKGTVKERSSKNPNLDTGDIEVFADDLIVRPDILHAEFIVGVGMQFPRSEIFGEDPFQEIYSDRQVFAVIFAQFFPYVFFDVDHAGSLIPRYLPVLITALRMPFV